jgi:dCTP deaminase
VRIEPWDEAMVQPASVDLRLGSSFRVFHNHRIAAIDLADPPQNLTELVEVGDEESFVIHPGEFVLGRTLEYVELPDDVVARIEGKSSLGRLGLIVHATGRLRRSRLQGDAHARDHEPDSGAHRPVAGQADRAARRS